MRKSKRPTKNNRFSLSEKIVFGVFMDTLEKHIETWQASSPGISFDEFLLGTTEEDSKKVKKGVRVLYGTYRRMIPKLINKWREESPNELFEEYLRKVVQRHEQIKIEKGGRA